MHRSVLATAAGLTCAGALTLGSAHTIATTQEAQERRPLAALGASRLAAATGVVTFRQTQFVFEAGRSLDTDWGEVRIDVDHVALRPLVRTTGGYVNVALHDEAGAAHWAVENLRVPPDGDRRGDGIQPARRRLELGSTQVASTPIGAAFDLRPGVHGSGAVHAVRATVLISPAPLPASDPVWQQMAQQAPEEFEVLPSVLDAEGDLGDAAGTPIPRSGPLLLGAPPQPIVPVPEPPSGFAAPFEITQYDQPNIQSALNQCMPVALANVIGYLRIRYNAPPLSWPLPHTAAPGIGRVTSNSDVVFWEPVPESSRVAQIDARTRRAGVLDFETGSGSERCQYLPALFSYFATEGTPEQVVFRHQGGEVTYGAGATCDFGDVLLPLGGITTQREGAQPTWEWVRDQLQVGRAVFMSFGRYDVAGERIGGHAVRIWGVRRFNARNYFYTLDDSDQGLNTSGLQTQQWEVADNHQPGLAGVPNGRLELGGTNWEVEFVMSAEARLTLHVP